MPNIHGNNKYVARFQHNVFDFGFILDLDGEWSAQDIEELIIFGMWMPNEVTLGSDNFHFVCII